MPRLSSHTIAYRAATGQPRRFRPRCEACGGPASRGWTDGEQHERCAACEVADAPIIRRTRAAVGRTRGECACGLWLDLTMDGVYHVYRLSDNGEHTRRDDWLGALALLGAIEQGRAGYQQMGLFDVAA